MNKDKKKLDVKELRTKGLFLLTRVGKYKLFIFLAFVALLYGFVWLKTTSYNNIQPSTQQIDSQVQAAALPHIDPTVLNQIQSLQDNSVNVQALFNQARSNPFSNN